MICIKKNFDIYLVYNTHILLLSKPFVQPGWVMYTQVQKTFFTSSSSVIHDWLRTLFPSSLMDQFIWKLLFLVCGVTDKNCPISWIVQIMKDAIWLVDMAWEFCNETSEIDSWIIHEGKGFQMTWPTNERERKNVINRGFLTLIRLFTIWYF